MLFQSTLYACFHETVHDKWCLNKNDWQTENGWGLGFVKHGLNSVLITDPIILVRNHDKTSRGSLGWTCYSYSLEIKQSFLVKMSTFVFIPYGHNGIRVSDSFFETRNLPKVCTGWRMPKLNDLDFTDWANWGGVTGFYGMSPVPLQTRNNRVFELTRTKRNGQSVIWKSPLKN